MTHCRTSRLFVPTVIRFKIIMRKRFHFNCTVACVNFNSSGKCFTETNRRGVRDITVYIFIHVPDMNGRRQVGRGRAGALSDWQEQEQGR